MGLCFSTRRAKGEGPTHPLPIPASSAGRELLPEPEESVKEVLSETPAKPPMQNAAEAISISVEKLSEISSDICNLSDTHSVSTEKRAEPEPEREISSRDRTKGARRVEAGSVGRTYSARAERNRALPVMNGSRSRSEEMKSTSPVTNRARWHSGELKLTPPVITAPRRHSGEMKQPKRSVSPMVKQQSAGQRPPRSLSAPRMVSRGNGKASPLRVPAPDLGRRKVPTVANSEGNESLENPLVSMECFIFL